MSLVAGPTDFTQVPAAGQHPRPARRSTGRATSGLGEGVMAVDECVRVWEGAYRYYGRMWELTARAPQGDPAAAREMAAASRAVAAAWRGIQAATPLPWWAIAALQSAAAAFDEQAQKYDEDSKNPTQPQARSTRTTTATRHPRPT